MHLEATLRARRENSFQHEDAENGAERREDQRRTLTLSAIATSPSSGETRVVIRDISPGGLLIEAIPQLLSANDLIELNLPAKGVIQARVVWRSGPFFGCEFIERVSTGAISAALLKSAPDEAPTKAQATDESASSPRLSRLSLEPELNFFVGLGLALLSWAFIAAAAYFLFS